MEERTDNPIITRYLLKWYKEYGRDLPWRDTTDPYKIWISEIILQQTRVVQGKDYYFRFIERFPNVESLANAKEEEVLKLWQGLGYYTRARNLHAAAKKVMNDFRGKFPSTFPDIITLKGVGEYTAAAISSIAFNEPHAVVDGNVYRVITRLFAIELSIHASDGKKIVKEIAQSLLDRKNPGKFNQAVMDFGAMVCTPSQPNCTFCVLQDYCMAFIENRVGEFPVNDRKISVKNRYFHYFHIHYKGCTFLHKRNGSDIWKNLFEFPLIETQEPSDFTDLEKTTAFKKLFGGISSISIDHRLSIKHQLSHQTLHTRFFRVIIPDEIIYTPPNDIFILPNEELPDYPVSRLTHKYLETI